jgi:hypothetical protein
MRSGYRQCGAWTPFLIVECQRIKTQERTFFSEEKKQKTFIR